MNHVIGMEAQTAPVSTDVRVGFAKTNVRRSVTYAFPVDQEPLEIAEDEQDEEAVSA